jgi:hypothetical protein
MCFFSASFDSTVLEKTSANCLGIDILGYDEGRMATPVAPGARYLLSINSILDLQDRCAQ